MHTTACPCPDAGPNRRQLKVKNPDKYNWKPKELLPQLASIYLHLDRADSEGAFARAIAVSDRYREDMFPETCQVGPGQYYRVT